MSKCIGTSTAPYTDVHQFPLIDDQSAIDGGYNNNAGAPGYGIKADGRKGKRRLELELERANRDISKILGEELKHVQIGRAISDGKWPYYTEILDLVPEC
jgi:hypothetical protein